MGWNHSSGGVSRRKNIGRRVRRRLWSCRLPLLIPGLNERGVREGRSSEPSVSSDCSSVLTAAKQLTAAAARPAEIATPNCTGYGSLKVKLHYAYKVRNIGRVRPILRYCVV